MASHHIRSRLLKQRCGSDMKPAGGAVACCRKQHDKEGYEKQREYQAVDKRAAAHAGCKGFVAGLCR